MSIVVQLNVLLHCSVAPNAFLLRLLVLSAFNIPKWRHRLTMNHHRDLYDFLEFGWPLGYTKLTPPQSSLRITVLLWLSQVLSMHFCKRNAPSGRPVAHLL